MDKIFGSKEYRKIFIFSIVVLLLLLILIRYCIFPIDALSTKTNENVNSFIDKFVASVFTAIVVGYFLYLMQLEEKKREITFTDSGYEIEKNLKHARTTTESWSFNGGLGRYTKSSTIPALSHLASTERRTISLNIIVLNPFNAVLVEKYIAFRTSVEKDSKKIKWTPSEVMAEILATIITALQHKKNNQFLDTKIFIKEFFTLTRMDISSTLAVITREDPDIPSIIAEKGSYMYRHYSEEFQQVLRQSKEVNYLFKTKSIDKSQVLECLNKIFPGETIDSDVVALVLDKVKNPKNPF